MVAKLGVPERRACRVLGQHRSTQRKPPSNARRRGGSDRRHHRARQAIRPIRLSPDHIAAAEAGWQVRNRVQRIWRHEGLKVPARQPKRGRLWLNDGSCIRLRPEHSNHVWCYDFVEERTHDGRKVRMMNMIDEFTRECLAIRVDRKLSSIDVIDMLSDLLSSAACPDTSAPTMVRSSWPRPCGLDRRGRRKDRLHRARQPMGERLLRELQRQAARRAAQWRDLLHPQGGPECHRRLALPLQQDPSALVARLQIASTGSDAMAGSATPASFAGHPDHGATAAPTLTFQTDHPMGAGQVDFGKSSREPVATASVQFVGQPPRKRSCQLSDE